MPPGGKRGNFGDFIFLVLNSTNVVVLLENLDKFLMLLEFQSRLLVSCFSLIYFN